MPVDSNFTAPVEDGSRPIAPDVLGRSTILRMLRRAVCLALIVVAIAARAAPGDAQQSWRAAAREAQLDDAEIEHLARTRLLLSTQSDRQIFDAYRRVRTPFVTTDSVLSAYHVLLEASVAWLEAARRPRLAWLLQSGRRRLARRLARGPRTRAYARAAAPRPLL